MRIKLGQYLTLFVGFTRSSVMISEKSRGQPYVFNKVPLDTNESSIEYYKQKKSVLYKELKAQEVCRHKFGYAKYSELIKSHTKKCSKCGLVKRVIK